MTKVSEIEAERIDAARGDLTRSAWLRGLIDAALPQPHVIPWAAPLQRSPERAFRAEREGNWITPEIHDHRYEVWNTETGTFPCGCDESDLPQ